MEHRGVVEAASGDLQPDRQPVRGPPGRYRRRGLAGQVERECERQPVERLHGAPADLGRPLDAMFEGRHGEGRGEQQVVVAEEPVGLEYSIVVVMCFFPWQRGPVMRRPGTRA